MVAGTSIDKINSPDIVSIGVHEVLKKLNAFEYQYLNNKGLIWLLFDNPSSVTRLRSDIDPEYKSHRDSMNENMKAGLNYLIETLKVYKDNFRVVFVDKLEADDLVKPLIEHINKVYSEDNKNNILLISNDMDWSKSITDKINWYNWKNLYTNEVFKNEYGFYPQGNSVQLFKALTGDKSDCIPNPFYNLKASVNWRFPKEYLNNILMNCTDINDFFDKLYSGKLDIEAKWIERLKTVEARIRLNYQLVDFYVLEDFDIKDVIVECKYSKAKLKFYFDTFKLDYEPRMIDVNKPEEFLTWAKYHRV